MGVWARLFGNRQPRYSVDDPVLGPVVPSSSASWWTATVDVGGERVEFDIGGTTEPAPELLAPARALVANWEAFRRDVDALLDAEAKGFADLPPDVAGTVRSLRIRSISILQPRLPRNGMIYFHDVPGSHMVWRCDIVDGCPVGLGADT